jgi:hypothetical protein
VSHPSARPSEAAESPEPDPFAEEHTDEHFKPVGTAYLLAIFVVVLILLWASVYLILLSRGTTV